MEYLDKNKESLSETQRKKYEQLKSDYIDQSLKSLSRNTVLNSEPTDTQAKKATIEAVTETIQGNTEERRALALIANGDIDGGLELLIKLASESAVDNMKQWRNIGRLSYSVDTTKALAAYKKLSHSINPMSGIPFIWAVSTNVQVHFLKRVQSLKKRWLACQNPMSGTAQRFSMRLAMYRWHKATYLRHWKATEPL